MLKTIKFKSGVTVAEKVMGLIADEPNDYYSSPRGAVEQVQSETETMAGMFGRLIETLHANGVISDNDFFAITKAKKWDVEGE